MRAIVAFVVFLGSVVLNLPLAAAAALLAGLVATLPGGDRDAVVPHLSAPARITLDDDGVARIRAANMRDAAAALGFAHARERMFQMELMRRAASGRLSELAGPATLRIDRMMRILGLRRRAEADFAALDATTKDLLRAYADGVNAVIAARGRLAAPEFLALGPPEFWTPVDSLLWGKTMALYLSGNWRTELARLALSTNLDRARIDALWPHAETGSPAAALMRDQTTTLASLAGRLAAAVPEFPAPFTEPAEASNAWAVDGPHSASGHPLLAGDPHLGFQFPGLWYLARIDTPDGVLAGATAPGVPMLVLGHNGHVAWTFTTTGADTEDLFVETPVGTDQYQTPDGAKPFTVRDETILVRGRPPEHWRVRETRHGPVVSDLINPNGPLLALASAGLAPGDTAAGGLVALNQAQTVADAGAAAARITSPVQNLVVADADRIALYVTGRVPVRASGDGAWPQPGADGAHDWLRLAGGGELPHVVAPESGRLVNANEPVAPPDFPVFLGRDGYGDARARRIRERLEGVAQATAQDFAAIQRDIVDADLRDALPALLATQPDSAADAALRDTLRGWDGSMAMDKPQPLIATAWLRAMAREVLRRGGVAEGASEAAAPWTDLARHALRDGACAGDCPSLLRKSLAEARAALAPGRPADPAVWRWGAAHIAVFAHPLLQAIPFVGQANAVRLPVPGGESTIDRGGMHDDSFAAVHGASFRAAYDLGHLADSLFMVAPGQSGHVASPLAGNLAVRWRDGASLRLGPYGSSVSARITLLPGQ